MPKRAQSPTQKNAHLTGRANKLDLNDAYAVKTPQDSRKLYAQWAETYNESFIKGTDYVYPQIISEHFASKLSAQNLATVIDIGCGTGAVGTNLARLRSDTAIDGFDISPEMLAHAAKLKRTNNSPVYRHLQTVDLTSEIPKLSYDAMISAGTFTHGHLGCETLISLVQLVRIGGWFVIGINAEHFSSQGFAKALQAAEDSQTISRPDFETVQIYGPTSPHAGDLAKIATFQRLN